MMEAYEAYMAQCNPLAKKIVQDEASLKHSLKNTWSKLGLKEQEQLLDDYLVDLTVRQKYADVEQLNSYINSFPKLKVETGEKIVVDFENDCWTWQDEHSSPFNWRSKSQQDLTLDDLEPDVLSKPPSKGKRHDSSRESSQPPELAGRQFSVDTHGEVWESSSALQGMEKPQLLDRSCSSTPTKSAQQSSPDSSRCRTPEEVNHAFKGSVDDLSSSMGSMDMHRSPSMSSEEILGSTPPQGPTKPTRRKRSFSKSPVKSLLSRKSESDKDEEILVTLPAENQHAFDNQAMGEQWSTFVNQQSEEEPSSATPSPYKTLLKEPQTVGIDRGDHSELLDGSLEECEDDFLHGTMTTDVMATDSLNASSASKSGFDFLDNW